MSKIRSIAATAVAAALMMAGVLAGAGTAAAEEKAPNLGPYNCMFPLTLLQEKDPLLAVGISCSGPVEAAPAAEEGPGNSENAPGKDKGGPGNSENAPGQDNGNFPPK